MAQIEGIFPFDPTTTVTGPVRVLYAPISEPLPVDLSDIIDLIYPYAPAGTWDDFGATESGSTYNRNLATQDMRVEQSTVIVRQEVTSLDRSLTVPIAEYRPETLTIFEGSRLAPVDVAAASGTSRQQKLPVGTITSLVRYRIAFVALRGDDAGIVIENQLTNPINRGRFFGFVGFQASISADNAALTLARSSLTSLPVTFQMYPESGQPSGQDHGYHIDEYAGTIAA